MTPYVPGVSASIRMLVVDDHPAVREGLRLLVSSQGMDICAEASRRDDALLRAEQDRPDLAVVDLSLDGEDGSVLVADLKARGVPVLVYSMHTDPRHVEGAFAAGALGYVSKAEFRGVLVDAIRAVAAGRRFVSPRAAVVLSEALAERQADGTWGSLSGQEREVYRLIGQGEGTHEISVAMNISARTVESYYARIQQKLGLEGMYELRRRAIDDLRQPSR